MSGFAYVGVHLYSGGCINALKNLIRRDYVEFCKQFDHAETVDGMKLSEVMEGRDRQERLDMAWRLYAHEKLTELGFTNKFERVYVELEEFEMLLGSMAVFHFGARYPCFSGPEKIPLDWWHLRLHLYIGNRLERISEAVADDVEFLKATQHMDVVHDPVAQNTIDLFRPPPFWRGLMAALQYFVSHGIEY